MKKNPLTNLFNRLFKRRTPSKKLTVHELLARLQHRDDINAGKPVTTRHGRQVICPSVSFNAKTMRSNMAAVLAQPRMQELQDQLAPLLNQQGDSAVLDESTGHFFLANDLQHKGREGATPLGEIDLAVERPIYAIAVDMIKMRHPHPSEPRNSL